ncbi:MAG: DUF87 domain-containing protein [Chloroflexi bacterium]|nr:MAG: DUF87 domain-containing protein [Chloroflexota bacterium]
MNTDGKLYMGRIYDPATAKTTTDPLLYDPDDLTTHGVVVGMTGSGKTGLCIDLLEEAALNNIPALMIDPKGDITNALLHFPDLAPGDFQPWVNADEARRDGKTVEQAAQDTADLWRNGLASWDIGPERLQALKDSVRFSIYTPGSDAGLPISILATLEAPDIPWASNQEMLREKISGTVTALLGLIGLKDIDPVRSREHILLANIFEHAWSQGKDLDLGELIMQTQAPPFEKLGVFPINRFFPEKDRFELAMMLNNMLASPAFQAWIEGEPLNIQRLLYDENGRSRHTIFYIAHLNEAERMFFVTLLYSAVETWMRSQAGSTTLRALVYFDEIFGYLPPVGNPPSKEPMLRMLKQARAFGVGMVLATQNPVDVDYKALSNAGTWFIGKLATEQDKARLLDGLASAVPGGLDTRAYDKMISSLGKRVFLLRNVHEKQPALFQTRWAMNYLAGPVTRNQIPALNALVGAGINNQQSTINNQQLTAAPQSPVASPQSLVSSPQSLEPEGPELPGTTTRPAVPSNIGEYFLPNNLTVGEAVNEYGRSLPSDASAIGLLYRPVLLAQAHIRYMQRKYALDHETKVATLVHEPDKRGNVRWEDYETEAMDPRKLDRRATPDARFAALEEPLSQAKAIRAMNTDFVDWLYRSAEVTIKTNNTLKVYAGPDISEEKFQEMCEDVAEEKAQVDIKKVETQYKKKLAAVNKKITREKRELAEDEEEFKRRKQEEAVKHAETIFGLFTGRKRSVSSSLSKRRMTAQAKADIEESQDAIAEFEREIEALKEELEDTVTEVEDKWEEIINDVTEISVSPYKKDIDPEIFGVAWFPYHLVQSGDRIDELPGFGTA